MGRKARRGRKGGGREGGEGEREGWEGGGEERDGWEGRVVRGGGEGGGEVNIIGWSKECQ